MKFLELLWLLAIELLKVLQRLIFGVKLKDLKGKVVLITGTARGLGRELAVQFSELGSMVLCVDINTEGNGETLNLLNNNKCHAYTCDVSDYDAVVKLRNDVRRDVDHVDILVNNAALLSIASLREGTPDILKKIIDVNILSHVWMLRVFLKDMIARNSGHIVAISSMSGIMPLSNIVTYSATKHAIVGMMGSLYQELQAERKHIKMTTVCPAGISTPLMKDIWKTGTSFAYDATIAAKLIIKGMREEKNFVSIPSWMWFAVTLARFLPAESERLILKYFVGRGLPKVTEEGYARFKEAYQLN